MHRSSHRALGLASVPQVCSFQLHIGSSSSSSNAARESTNDCTRYNRTAQLHMVGRNAFWGKPPCTQCSCNLACEDLLCLALQL
eukprot:1659324-Amphidinium_carterae.1